VTSSSSTTTNPTIINALSYNLDITGLSDTSTQFQKMVDSYPSGSTIKLPKGIYKFSKIVNLKDGIKLIASNDVVIPGIGKNILFSTGNDNTFKGIEFQKCSTAKVLSAQNNGIDVTAGSSNCTITDNNIANTNLNNNINATNIGNGILLDWNGIADPRYITISNNKIGSNNGIIAKSGIYSTSNTTHHNKIGSNIIKGYKYGVHWYTLATCGV